LRRPVLNQIMFHQNLISNYKIFYRGPTCEPLSSLSFPSLTAVGPAPPTCASFSYLTSRRLLGLVCASNWSIMSNERLTIFYNGFLTSCCRIGFDNSTYSISWERYMHCIRVSPSGCFKRVIVLKKRGRGLSCY
jgi:hypothetical protein